MIKLYEYNTLQNTYADIILYCKFLKKKHEFVLNYACIL